MTILTITIPGQPIAKKRPRFVRRGRFVGTYNAQETEEGKFALQAMEKMAGTPPFAGPLHVRLSFEFERPKAHMGTCRGVAVLKKSAPMRHTSKPDIDNLEKFVLDALNGILWLDDSQIYRIEKRKEWAASTPSTTIEIISEATA